MNNFGTNPGFDPKPYGEKPSDPTPRYGEEKKKYCCRGTMHLNGLVAFTAASPTLVNFEATVSVETSVACLDIKCEGRDWKGFTYTTCDTEMEDPEANTMYTDGNGIIEINRLYKLGCCSTPAKKRIDEDGKEYYVDSWRQTVNHTFNGTVPGKIVATGGSGGNDQALDNAYKLIINKFASVSGDTPPYFKKCD